MLFAFFLKLYFLVGIVLSVYFLIVGYKKLLPKAEGTRFGVRILWVPAAIAIWPVCLIKLFSAVSRK